MQAALAKGRPLPEWALNEPPLYKGDDFFLTAFYDLSSCRPNSEAGPGPIPWDKTVEYSDRAGLDQDMGLAFVHIVRELDSAYIAWAQKKIKAARNIQPPKVGKNAGIQYRSHR